METKSGAETEAETGGPWFMGLNCKSKAGGGSRGGSPWFIRKGWLWVTPSDLQRPWETLRKRHDPSHAEAAQLQPDHISQSSAEQDKMLKERPMLGGKDCAEWDGICRMKESMKNGKAYYRMEGLKSLFYTPNCRTHKHMQTLKDKSRQCAAMGD